MFIYVNGKLTDQAQAVISAYDHGFLYGIGLFETFRTYGGRPFLLERHLARLEDGCGQLAIRQVTSVTEVRRQIAALLEANCLADAYFRLTVTAGPDALGLPAGDYERPTVILYVKPLPAQDESLYRLGKQLHLLRTRRNTPEGPYRLKSLHYMNNLLAKIELQSALAASSAIRYAHLPEGLMLTAAGHVAEGIVSNVFFVKDGCLFTPSLETGILPGITRAFVVELAAGCGMAVREGLYEPDALFAADEVFVTNSIQELVPISLLIDERGAERPIGAKAVQDAASSSSESAREGTAGPITRKLLDLYRKEANS
jgi:4-amino-4-deoxychorismate lyase